MATTTEEIAGFWRRQLHRLRRPLLVLALLVVLYQALLYPAVTRALLTGAVGKFTNGTLELEVQRSSLLYGFDFKNVRLGLRDGAPLFQADRLRLAWFLPGALAGRIGVRELLLDRPRFFIHEKDGQLNWARLLSSSAPREEEPRSGERLRAIRTYFTLQAYFNLRIQDLQIHYLAERPNSRTEARISNVDLFLAFVTHEFDSIPLHPGAIDLFETFLLALNPTRPIQIELQGARPLQGALKASCYLYRDGRAGAQEFATRMNLDASRLNVGGRALGLNIYYDIAYDAPGDRLLVRGMEVRNYGERWLALRAEAINASSPGRRLNLELLPSRIPLADVGRTLAALSGADRAPISGDSLYIDRFSLRGRMDRLLLESKLRLDDLRFGGGPLQRIERAAVDLSAELDLYRALPVLEPPPNYRPHPGLIFGSFYRLVAPEISVAYNQARAAGAATMLPDSGIKMSLRIENLNLARFAPQAAAGMLEARLEASSSTDFSRLGLQGQLRLTQARYFIGRSRSGLHTLSLNLGGQLHLKDGLTEIEVDRLRLDTRSPEGAPMALLDAAGRMAFSGGRQTYDLKVRELDLVYSNLHPALPGQLRYSLQPLKLYLSRGASLKLQARYERTATRSDLRASGQLAVPFLKLNDLSFQAGMDFSPERTHIESLRIDGLKGALAIRAQGELNRSGGVLRPALRASLRIAQDELIPIHENIALGGALSLDAQVDAERVRGKFGASNLNVHYTSGDCSSFENRGCTAFFINRMNAELPFEHSLRYAPATSGSAESDYFNAYGRSGAPNFTVVSVASNRTPNGQIAPGSYYYLGSPAGDSGLQARIQYASNTVFLHWLRLAAYRRLSDSTPPASASAPASAWAPNGLIDGRSIFFRLADLKPAHMAFAANLQIKNLDLQPFLPQTRSNYDGVVSADIKAGSPNLGDALYSTQAQLNVFRISREFSGFATRVLMPGSVAFLVRNTVEVPSIRVELRGGLVYSYIGVRRGGLFPGLVIAPGEEEIKQERMPLAQFLERARSEVQDFPERGAGGDGA